MTASEMKMQRDQALACLILAVCITLAVFLSVFGRGEKLAIENARSAVSVHEALLRESAQALKQNQEALGAVRASLAKIEHAPRR
jgi:hypothetical protein